MKNRATTINGISLSLIGRFLSELESRQFFAGEMASALRDDTALQQIGEFPTAASRFYRGLWLSRHGELGESEEGFASLTRAPACLLRSKAYLAIGTLNFRRGEIGAAELNYRAASDYVCDPVTAARVLKAQAVIRAIRGDHDRALAELERSFLLIRILPRTHPFVLDIYNSIAVEMIAGSQIDRARPLARLVTSAAIASRYPEWIETARALQPERARSAVQVLSHPQTEPARILTGPWLDVEAEERRRFARRAEVITRLSKASHEQVEACDRVLDSTPTGLQLVRRAANERDEDLLRKLLRFWDLRLGLRVPRLSRRAGEPK